MPHLVSIVMAITMAAADWQPVALGPRTSTAVAARLAVECLGRVPRVAYQLVPAGVAVRVGSRTARAGCAQAAVNAALEYRDRLPAGTEVRIGAHEYLRGVVLSHATPEGAARLHQLARETVAAARR